MSYKNVKLTAQGAEKLARRLLDYVDARVLNMPEECTYAEERIAQHSGPCVDLSLPRNTIVTRRFTEGLDYTTRWMIDADDVLVCGCGHVYLPDWQCTMAETRDEPAEYEARCPECHVSADEAEPLSDLTEPRVAGINIEDCASEDLYDYVRAHLDDMEG